MRKLMGLKVKDMFQFLKLILKKNMEVGLMRSGSSGTKRNAKYGKMTPHHLVRTYHGMNWKLRRSRSCWTRSWDGSC